MIWSFSSGWWSAADGPERLLREIVGDAGWTAGDCDRGSSSAPAISVSAIKQSLLPVEELDSVLRRVGEAAIGWNDEDAEGNTGCEYDDGFMLFCSCSCGCGCVCWVEVLEAPLPRTWRTLLFSVGHVQSSRLRRQPLQRGFSSLHFFLRRRHVKQPVLLRIMGIARISEVADGGPRRIGSCKTQRQ